MANKIKGITIEIGGDTTGLDKALRGVNSEIKNTQNDLKEVEKSLKLDPANIELLEQKQRLLGEAVKATTEKLDTLKEAQAQAAEQLARGDIGQEQYDALTREIVNTEAALKRATEEAKSFNAEAQQMSAKLGAVSTAAGKVSKATKGLSTAAAGVVAGIGALAVNSAKSADELQTLSQQSGLTTDELQRMQYASELVDVSVEDMVGAQSKLRKAMMGSGEAFTQLGISVTTSDGQMRNSTEVFYEVLTALSQVGNETERDQLAMQIFGKSADQLAGIIDDGGASLKAYGDEAAQLGLIMDEETLTSLNKVNDELDKIKAQASGQLAKAGAAALEALTPLIEQVVDVLSKVLEKIGELSPQTIETIAIIAGIVAAISPLAGLIAGVTGAISKVLLIWPQVQAAFAAVTAFVAANPIVLIIAAVAALAAVIIKHWDEIKPVLDAFWAKVKEVAESVVNWIKDAIATVRDAFMKLKEFFSTVFTNIVDTVKEKINAIIEWVNKGISKINELITAANNSGLGKALGLNIGTIGTIDALPTSQGNALLSQNGAGSSSSTTTYNTTNTYNQTSSQPVNVNLNLDGQTLARQLVTPLRTANAAAGGSNLR